jgi:23S rRNA pseudouridine1911/1915/1917 synthase
MSLQQLVVTEEDPLCRIDLFLHLKFPDYSRTYFQHLIEESHIKVNGKIVKKRESVTAGDSIEILFQKKESLHLTPQDMLFDILYEDDALLVINKPRGLVVHPAPGHPHSTIVNGLLHRYKGLDRLDPIRPGIVHRLDKDTSGVLLIAKTPKALETLSLAFKQRQIYKEYLALCMGNPGIKTIQNKLGRDPRYRQKIAVVNEGREAISVIETLTYKTGYSLVKILPSTGRTHQIRVHLQSLGCPVLGDSLYGNPHINQKLGLSAQMLHAHILSFQHPLNRQMMSIEAKLPNDMKELKKKLL